MRVYVIAYLHAHTLTLNATTIVMLEFVFKFHQRKHVKGYSALFVLTKKALFFFHLLKQQSELTLYFLELTAKHFAFIKYLNNVQVTDTCRLISQREESEYKKKWVENLGRFSRRNEFLSEAASSDLLPLSEASKLWVRNQHSVRECVQRLFILSVQLLVSQ